MKRIDDRIIKIKVDKTKRSDGLPIYPYNLLSNLPYCECAFDSYRGTIGFDVFPFSVTTRIIASNQVYVKVYEETY